MVALLVQQRVRNGKAAWPGSGFGGFVERNQVLDRDFYSAGGVPTDTLGDNTQSEV